MKRREFLNKTACVAGLFIVPRYVLGRGFTAPSDKINFGFIGCGKQSGGLQNAFLSTNKVQVVAACDPFKAKITRFIAQKEKFYANKTEKTDFKSTEAHADFRELIARKDIDAVVIATPDHWHAAIAVRACAAGKDVYCEKPLALTVHEGRAMVNAAHKYNRVFQTGSMQRSWKEFRQAVELVRNGYIGDIKKVIVTVGGAPKKWDLQPEPLPSDLDWNMWLGPNTIERPYNSILAPDLVKESTMWPLWRNYNEFGGGGMTDWGAHMFDIAQWGLDMDNSGPREIIPINENGKPGLIYKYKNGVEMIHATEGNQSCKFIGTKGEVYVQRGKITSTIDGLAERVIGANEKHVYFSDNHYEDFLKAIKTRQKPICDVEIGHRTASVCNIGNIAYQLNRPLHWNPRREKFKHDDEANALLSRPMKTEWSV